jgi:hypothetical protein
MTRPAITDARFDLIDNYPHLRVRIGGREATLGTEWKPLLRRLGLVCLDHDFEGIAKQLDVIDPDTGQNYGGGYFSDDPRLVELMEQLWAAANDPDKEFPVGPVKVPAI